MDKIWSLFSGNSNILRFLLSPVRFTKCLGVRVPLRPPRIKALGISLVKAKCQSEVTVLVSYVLKYSSRL
jgi:hypothetical protein